jgi:hypothetical protein
MAENYPFELHSDESFQKAEWQVQRIGWVL